MMLMMIVIMIRMMMMIAIMMMLIIMMMIIIITVEALQSDRRCFKASVQLNQGARKLGLLTLKINLDRSSFHMGKMGAAREMFGTKKVDSYCSRGDLNAEVDGPE